MWARLIACVATLSNVSLKMLPHPAPRPVEELWARPDLGLVMMCGWPFHRALPQPVAVAAPVLDDAAAAGKPVYWTDMIVRADQSAQTLEDTFGTTLAWTVTSSHSGYNAPRHLLQPYFEANGSALYRKTVGPVITPRGAIEAVLSGAADVAPLDGFYHLLLKQHEPETAARLRIVSRTPMAPIPLFTASPGADQILTKPLKRALLTLHEDEQGRAMMSDLRIARFVGVDPGDYAVTQDWHEAALAAGYPVPM